jgi:hypothetical protein
MPKRTKEKLMAEIKSLSQSVSLSVGFALEDGLDVNYIGMAKRRAQELAVECQRLEDLMDDRKIEEAVQQLRKGLEDES